MRYCNQLFRLHCGICSRIRSGQRIGQICASKSQQKDFSLNNFFPALLRFDDGFIQRHSAVQQGKFRCLHTTTLRNTLNVWPYKITSRLAAEQLVREMNDEERARLFTVLQDLDEELQLEQGITVKPLPNFNQLWMLAFTNSIPFIGFGFLDNAIMILAGEYIDYTLGAALGISTMAAAAIGNMISDVAGIGLAGYVEVWASRLGFEEPNLTQAQLAMTQSRIACHLGRAIGIVIGCVIGMIPLLFIAPRGDKQTKDQTE